MRVAVVTGAARGIGAAVALTLARDGWALALGDVCRDDPALGYPLAGRGDLANVSADCRALGAVVVEQVCDVRVQQDVDALVRSAAGVGPIEAAVAVAGVLGGHGAAWELPPELVERDLDVNYRGPIALARAAVPHLLEAGSRGRYVAVASAAAASGLPRLASYSASKHAVLGYVRGLAADLARSGVTANAVLPGSTDTALLSATARVYGLSSSQDFAQHARAGRLLAPSEIAAVVGWLCSPAATGTTGAAIPVDGGFHG